MKVPRTTMWAAEVIPECPSKKNLMLNGSSRSNRIEPPPGDLNPNQVGSLGAQGSTVAPSTGVQAGITSVRYSRSSCPVGSLEPTSAGFSGSAGAGIGVGVDVAVGVGVGASVATAVGSGSACAGVCAGVDATVSAGVAAGSAVAGSAVIAAVGWTVSGLPVGASVGSPLHAANARVTAKAMTAKNVARWGKGVGICT